MKRLLSVLLGVALFFVAPLVHAQNADPYRGTEHIASYDVHIAIQTDGTMQVKEQIVYDFGDLERHGIFRDIPYVTINDAGKRFAMDFSEAQVTDEKGNAYTFVQSTEGDDIRWKIGDADKTISGKHTYVVTYTVAGALTYFPGHDELYWDAIGDKWPVPITEATVSITLPESAQQGFIETLCFTPSAKSSATDCYIQNRQLNSVFIGTKKPLPASDGLTVVAAFPKGIVAVLEPREMVPFFDSTAGKTVLILLAIGVLIWYVVLPVWVVRKWWTTGRDPKPAMGEAKAWFSPPKNPHHRNLTPAETGTLVDERADLRDIYASVVDLARRGYIKIIEVKKNTFDLEKTKDWAGDAELQPFERDLLSGIFKSGDLVSIKTLDLTKTLENIKTMLYETLVSDKFFPGNPNTLRGWYIALAVVSLILFNPILFLISLIFGLNMPRKTLFGAQQAAVARSLRNFLVSQDKQLAFQAKNKMMFEKLLPFAIAFGVEEIWAKRFADLAMKNPDWYVSSTGGRFNSVVFAHSISHGMSSSFAASIAAHSSTGHSSGFSGGFSGGGGGGGGGGSW